MSDETLLLISILCAVVVTQGFMWMVLLTSG